MSSRESREGTNRRREQLTGAFMVYLTNLNETKENLSFTTVSSEDGVSGLLLDSLATDQNFSELLAPVQADLLRVERKMKTVESSVFAPLADAFVDLIGRGGKRLRPALALLSAGLEGSAGSTSELIALAAAVEMLHTATLVHDDVIDGALLRRGAPTLNASWSQGATALAGNYMVAQAALFAAETRDVPVIQLFSDTLRIIVDGELRQLVERNDFSQELGNYYQRIYAKTASLYSAATESAALLGGLANEKVEALTRFGHDFGIAFQIIDDVLDFTGSNESLGKPAGSDLRQGTLTLPFFHYLESLENPAAVIDSLSYGLEKAEQGDPSILHELVAELVVAVRSSSAVETARHEAIVYLSQAVDQLAIFPDSQFRRSLLGLCAFVIQRSS